MKPQTKYLDLTPDYVTVEINGSFNGFNHVCTVHSHGEGVNTKSIIFKMHKNRFQTITK